MRKQHLFALFLCLMLAGCAVIESSEKHSTKAITEAEAKQYKTAYLGDMNQEERPTTDQEIRDAYGAYSIKLEADTIKVIDNITGATIHDEKYDSGSGLAKAILKDNE